MCKSIIKVCDSNLEVNGLKLLQMKQLPYIKQYVPG